MTVKKVKRRGKRHYVKKRRFDPNFDPHEHNYMVTYGGDMDAGTSLINTFLGIIMIIVTLYAVIHGVEWLSGAI